MALLDESIDNIPLETGFDDPVYESQIVFRKILKVMSEPGTIKKIKKQIICSRSNDESNCCGMFNIDGFSNKSMDGLTARQ